MNKEEIKSHLIQCAEKTFSKDIESIKKDLYKSCKKNAYGCSDYLADKENGYSLFYTDNQNFCNGEKNGYGAGYYARLKFTGFTNDIKLSN
jgi:hypothetical protein